MHSFTLQDWITIRGTNNTVTQSESEWLDLTQYEDLVFWIDVREVFGAPVTLNIQTSPTKDEAFFGVGAMYSAAVAVGTAAPSKLLMSAATVPVARYVRWSLTSASAPYDVTFRIFIAANAPGV